MFFFFGRKEKKKEEEEKEVRKYRSNEGNWEIREEGDEDDAFSFRKPIRTKTCAEGEEIKLTVHETVGDFPTASLGLSTCYDEETSEIYVTGFRNEANGKIFVFNTKTLKWRKLPTEIPEDERVLCFSKIGNFEGKKFLFCYAGHSLHCMNSLCAYNISKNTWKTYPKNGKTIRRSWSSSRFRSEEFIKHNREEMKSINEVVTLTSFSKHKSTFYLFVTRHHILNFKRFPLFNLEKERWIFHRAPVIESNPFIGTSRDHIHSMVFIDRCIFVVHECKKTVTFHLSKYDLEKKIKKWELVEEDLGRNVMKKTSRRNLVNHEVCRLTTSSIIFFQPLQELMMMNGTKEHQIFIFDTKYGTWSRYVFSIQKEERIILARNSTVRMSSLSNVPIVVGNSLWICGMIEESYQSQKKMVVEIELEGLNDFFRVVRNEEADLRNRVSLIHELLLFDDYDEEEEDRNIFQVRMLLGKDIVSFKCFFLL